MLGSKLAGGDWARSRIAEPGLGDLALAAQRGEIPMPVDPAGLTAADRLLGEVLDQVTHRQVSHGRSALAPR